MTVEGETPETPPAGGATPPTTTPSTGSETPPTIDYKAEYEKLRAENETLLGKKSALEADLHKLREKRQQELADLEEQGKYKALSEEQKARIAELEALLPDAELGKSYREREEARIKTVREKMDEGWQAALDAAPSFAAKVNLVELFMRQQASANPPPDPKPKPPADGGGPPAHQNDVDVAALLKSGRSPDDIRREHPEAWARYVNPPSSKPKVGFASLFGRK